MIGILYLTLSNNYNLEKKAINTVEIKMELKKKHLIIDLADIFIAAIAKTNRLPIATLNYKHFSKIEELKIVSV